MENERLNVESVRAWLRTCPTIENSRYFRVDYIDDDPKCYAIFSVPSPINYKTDILGETYPDAVQTLNFYFCVTCPWGKDIKQNIANLKAVSDVVAWLEAQNAAKSFPELTEGKVVSIMPTLSPQPIQQTAETAVYQISIKLTYRR